MNTVVFAPTEPTSTSGPHPPDDCLAWRLISKPLSFDELSVHRKVTTLPVALMEGLLGAAGIAEFGSRIEMLTLAEAVTPATSVADAVTRCVPITRFETTICAPVPSAP